MLLHKHPPTYTTTPYLCHVDDHKDSQETDTTNERTTERIVLYQSTRSSCLSRIVSVSPHHCHSRLLTEAVALAEAEDEAAVVEIEAVVASVPATVVLALEPSAVVEAF
jgi:hypothetical protein